MTDSSLHAYFDTPERAERLMLVAHLLRNADLVPYVRGPSGAGKTRFAEQLAAMLGEEEVRVALFSARRSDVPAAICQSLGVALSDWPRGVLDSPAGSDLVVLIDDADALPPEAEIDLLALQQGGGRLVLLGRGDPEALSAQWPLQLIDLPPFTEDQARDFLAYVGHPDATLLSNAALHRLHQQASGQPGPLLAGSPGEQGMVQHEMKAGAPWKWVLGGFIAVLVILVLWQQERINALFAPQAPVAAAPDEVESAPGSADVAVPDNRIAIPPLPKAPTPELEDAPVQTAVPPQTASTEVPAVERESVEPEMQFSVSPDPTELVAPQMEVTQPSDTVEDPMATPSHDATTIAEPQPIIRPQELSRSITETMPVPAMPMDQPDSGKPADDKAVAVAPAPAGVKPPEVAPPKPVPAPKTPRAVQTGAAGDIAWLRSRPPGHYTLQLLGARDQGAVDKYIRSHQLPEKYVVFMRDLGGKPWYSLVHGDYPSRDAALRGRDALPASLRKAGVWPRTFASIVAQLPTAGGVR